MASAATFARPSGLAAAPSREVLELARVRAGRPLPAPPVGSLEEVAQDEAYWREVAAQYADTDAVVRMIPATFPGAIAFSASGTIGVFIDVGTGNRSISSIKLMR